MKRKRLLSALLAGVLALTLVPSVYAAQTSETEMAQVLSALDIMTGDEKGDLMLERNVTRAEFTKLAIAASPYGENVGEATTVSPYPDVPYTKWSAPYVEAAKNLGLVQGNLYGYFEPDRSISLREGVTIVVRLLGYQDSDFSGAWPSGQMALYRRLDLDEGIDLGPTAAMTRRDSMKLFYNLLTTKTKQGVPYLTTLGHALTLTGEIDRVALINSAMRGPIVVETGWQSKVNFDLATTKAVYRNGTLTALSALQPNDILYWSKSMRTLWAYSDKVTGRYQAVAPSASSPSTVTVAGRTCVIETADAAYDLSNLGRFKTGDTVTLLLGRDGGVAAVTTPSAAVSGTVAGVVSAVMDQPYTDASGNSYTAKTVVLTATNGNSYSYPVGNSSTWKAGDLVQAAVSGNEAQIKRLTATPVSGRVNAGATKLGNIDLADGLEILDADKNGNAVKIQPDRLAGVDLESGQVKYCRKNSAGEIDILILNDVTGDMDSYGVVTLSEETEEGMFLRGTYQYDVGGVTYPSPYAPYVLSNGTFHVSKGPAVIKGGLTAPDKIKQLTSVKLTAVDAENATTEGSSTFPVWENVSVYELEDGSYHFSSLERVRTGYILTGWYDKAAAKGGRIRVIVARPQA